MATSTRQRLGFIGAGMMAEALMGGMDAAGVVTFSAMGCFDPYKPTRDRAADKGVKVFETSADLVQNSEAVFLAVKPNIIPAVCSEIHGFVKADNLVISIAAGISIAKLESMLPPGSRVVRVMPNTPCLISEGASGYAKGSCATDADMDFVGKLLSSIGYAVQVKKEDDLHAGECAFVVSHPPRV
jgi:pyrroline-5-carboxylate reductase